MRSNIDVVREAYGRFAATGDVAEEFITADFVWDMSHFRGWPENQTYRGADGAREFLRAWIDAWEDWQLVQESLEEVGDQVLAIMRQRGRAKSTGMIVEMTFAQVWTLRDGLESRMEMYADPVEAKRALGLEE